MVQQRPVVVTRQPLAGLRQIPQQKAVHRGMYQVAQRARVMPVALPALLHPSSHREPPTQPQRCWLPAAMMARHQHRRWLVMLPPMQRARWTSAPLKLLLWQQRPGHEAIPLRCRRRRGLSV